MKRNLLAALAAALVASAASAGPDAAVIVTRSGSAPGVEGSAENFTGLVRIGSRFQAPAPARAGGGTVTFEPAARTAWHSHPLGQTLIVTAGNGLVQHWAGPIRRIGPGDVVWIPPGVKHWHGAGPTSGMTHVAIAEASDRRSVTWMEQVSDRQYHSLD